MPFTRPLFKARNMRDAKVGASHLNPSGVELVMNKKQFAALILTIFSMEAANAACMPKDAAGTWVTYQGAFVAAKQADEHVGECTLTIDKSGNVDASVSTCQFVTFNTPNLPTGGTVSVSKDCSLKISLTLGGLVGSAQMSKSKNTWSGRFVAQNGAISGTTNAVKK